MGIDGVGLPDGIDEQPLSPSKPEGTPDGTNNYRTSFLAGSAQVAASTGGPGHGIAVSMSHLDDPNVGATGDVRWIFKSN